MSEPITTSRATSPTKGRKGQITGVKPSDIELTAVSASDSAKSASSALSKEDEVPVAKGQKILGEKLDAPQPTIAARRHLANIHFFALCWSLFLIGWNDGSLGPLIPRIQKYYDVRPMCGQFCRSLIIL